MSSDKSRSILCSFGWVIAIAILVAGSPAAAYTITPVGTTGGSPGGQTLYEVSGLVQGDSFALEWTLDGSGAYGGTLPDLDASAFVSVTSLSATTLVLDVTLSNDTAPLLGITDLEAAITVFGFEVLGVDLGNLANSLSSAGSNLDTYDEGNLSGGFSIDVCASTSAGCNVGSPRFGIQIGENDSFQFTLQGTFDTSNLTLSHFGTKWQTNWDEIMSGAESSFELSGEPNPPIPEPSTALLVGLGLVGLATTRRSRPRAG